MYALIRALLIAALLMLSVPVWGDDGDTLAGASMAENMDGGALWSSAFVLCDAKVAADSTCDEFDLESASGLPHSFTVSIESANNCDPGYAAAVIGHTTSGGDPHVWFTLDVDLSSMVVWVPPHRFLSADITSAGCDTSGGPGLTVSVVFHYDRN